MMIPESACVSAAGVMDVICGIQGVLLTVAALYKFKLMIVFYNVYRAVIQQNYSCKLCSGIAVAGTLSKRLQVAQSVESASGGGTAPRNCSESESDESLSSSRTQAAASGPAKAYYTTSTHY